MMRGRWTALSGIALFAATSHVARAADVDAICGGAAAAELPSAADLARAAQAAEGLLRTRSAQPSRAQELLGAPPVQAKASIDPAALAAYCSAAGEAARTSSTGSAWQAQTYLQSAIRYAAQAGGDRVYAQSAYRMALASLGGVVVNGARGGGRRSADPRRIAADIQQVSADECAYLESPDLLQQSTATISAMALSCAAARARRAGDVELAARSSLRLANLLVATAESAPDRQAALRAEAARVSLAAMGATQSGPPAPLMLELLGRLTEAAIGAGAPGDPGVARAIYTMRLHAAGSPAMLAFAYALEGRSALGSADRRRASAALRQAVFYEAQRAQPLRMADWLLLLADAEPEREAELVMDAYRALDQVRPLLPVHDTITEESSFALRMRPVFERAVEIQLAPSAGLERIAAAQTIVEQYREAELQSVLGVNCVAPQAPIRPAELRPDELLLYPILLPDRLELLYATGAEGAKVYHRLPPNGDANRATVAHLVGELTDSASYGDNNRWRAPARHLYELLIKPIEAMISPDTTLVIVPDGPLRALPFSALTAADGRFLIEKTRISIAPSLGYSLPGIDRGAHPLAVVAGSLEQEVILPAGVFPRLEGTAREARVAAEAASSTHGRARLIENFKRADLADALAGGRVDVLHLATHATFNGSSERSFILALDGPVPISDLRRSIGRSRDRGDQLDLLILSACETAVGDDQASMGLAGAAVQAGARSALASLWQVNDVGTAELMKNFYASYSVGKGKAEALRNAQLAMLTRGGEFANPNIWAAFELLGGWR